MRALRAYVGAETITPPRKLRPPRNPSLTGLTWQVLAAPKVDGFQPVAWPRHSRTLARRLEQWVVRLVLDAEAAGVVKG